MNGTWGRNTDGPSQTVGGTGSPFTMGRRSGKWRGTRRRGEDQKQGGFQALVFTPFLLKRLWEETALRGCCTDLEWFMGQREGLRWGLPPQLVLPSLTRSSWDLPVGNAEGHWELRPAGLPRVSVARGKWPKARWGGLPMTEGTGRDPGLLY